MSNKYLLENFLLEKLMLNIKIKALASIKIELIKN